MTREVVQHLRDLCIPLNRMPWKLTLLGDPQNVWPAIPEWQWSTQTFESGQVIRNDLDRSEALSRMHCALLAIECREQTVYTRLQVKQTPIEAARQRDRPFRGHPIPARQTLPAFDPPRAISA